MKKRIISTILCLTLALSMTGILSGCGEDTQDEATEQTKDLMTSIEPDFPESDSSVTDSSTTNSAEPESIATDPIEPSPKKAEYALTGKEHIAISDFSVKLFQQSLDESANTLISPISVIYALGMTANGAKDETLSQMENVFGLPIDTLNYYLSDYMEQLPAGEKYKLHIANAIWFRDSENFNVEQDFLQANADFYNAGLYRSPFDQSTVQEINNWVKEHTDNMIPNVLEKIPEDAVMYLVNALAFDAEWQSIYYDYEVADGTFTKEDGTTQDIELMYSSERDYLEDENATGFIKYYKDRKYAFAALLPNEGVSVAEYIAALTGEHLHDMLSNPTHVEVNAAIPKFETEYSIPMNDALKAMGMTDAFDFDVADFSGIGSSSNGNLAISNVLHKTFISVDERGTKAGAATVVEVDCESALVEEVKTVYLDRPFVYMLIDCENNLPIFIGTTMEINQ